MHSTPAAQDVDHDGAVLLDEEIHYIDDQGRRYLVAHHIWKAFNDNGAKENSEDTYYYRKANQKICLIAAQTILPDGRRLPVAPGAAILQSPQRQADYSLYDDQGELRLIFPSVKPGAISESTIVIEESQFRIPGEFTAAFAWARGWPVQELRRTFEMPAALAARFQSTTIGAGVPEPEKQPVGKDRVRWTWKSTGLAALPPERNLPPTLQSGPALWLTTLRDWPSFARWYAPLVDSRTELKPALKQQIDEWTKAAEGTPRVIEILMAKVANDIRYVGLEFGTSDLQPHDGNEVWENQYGDCKDKANLLRAMLRYKGIAAHLVLVNTQQAGRIEWKSPDYRQFTHAIVAVEAKPGQYTFCDPTISYAGPGLLSPADTDRDVLLIKDGGAEWAHTPPQDAGNMHYDLNLKLGTDGELSGWLTQEMSGYYGAVDADQLQRIDKNQLFEKAHSLLRGFFKEAEVVDVTKTPIEKWDGTSRLKTYFIVPGAKQERNSTLHLAFPQANSLFVDVGVQKTRTTPYYVWRDGVSVNARIKLPEGYAPANLPRAFHSESAALEETAQWSASPGECRASLEVKIKQNLIPAAQFDTFRNALLSLRFWLDSPLLLSTAGAPAPAPQEKVALEDFPMMSDGEAQLDLVDQRYPSDGNTRLRREALQKAMQYFPTDRATHFNAGLKLAVMDWDAGNARAAADQVIWLLQTYRSNVTAEEFAWGEYLQAMLLDDLQQSAEAVQIFERLGRDEQISQRRRAWSDYQRARIVQTQSKAQAIEALRAGLAFETDAQPSIFTLLAKLLVLEGQTPDLKKEIAQLVARNPARLAAILTRLADGAGTLLPVEKTVERAQLIQLLEEAGKSADPGPRFAEALQGSRSRIQALTAASGVQESLKQKLAEHPLPALDPAAAQFRTREDFAHGVDDALKQQKAELCLRYEIELLTRFEPDKDFPSHLWKATDYAEWKERLRGEAEPLLPSLFELCDRMPPDSDTYADGKLLRAKVCARSGDLSGARKIHEEMLRNPSLQSAFRVVVHDRLAGNLESVHDYRGALEIYRAMESEVEFVSAKEALLRAAFLNLELGQREEALRILAILAGRSASAINQAATGAQITDLLAFVKNLQDAEKYWSASAKWWPEWLALEQRLGMEPLGEEQIIPAIADLPGLGTDFGTALRAKDRRGVFASLRLIAHAARWQPSMSNELGSLLAYVPSLVPDCAHDLRRFGITLAEDFVSDRSELVRKNQLWGAVYAIDSSDTAKALEFLRAFAELPPLDDEITHAMARLHGMAAQRDRGEIAIAIADLEKAVASPTLHSQRGLTITLLADLYRLAGRADDEEKLLQRELKNPENKTEAADFQALTAREQQLSQTGEESRNFAQAVERWSQKCRPAWFDLAEPKTLEDARLANLDEVLKKPGRIFSNPEVIKLCVLAAASPGVAYSARLDAFNRALEGLAGLALTNVESQAVFQPIIDDPAAPEILRRQTLESAIFDARLTANREDFERLCNLPLAKGDDRARTAVEIYRKGLAAELSTPDATLAFCEDLLRKEVRGTALWELRRAYTRLLNQGQLDMAGKIRASLATVNISSDTGSSAAALQLEWLKASNQAKRWLPVATALRDLVLAKFPADTIHEPAVYATMHDPHRLDWLAEDSAEQIRLYQIKTQRFDLANLHFWKEFIRDARWIQMDRKSSFELIAAALKSAPDDDVRATAMSSLVNALDEDDAEVRAEFTRLFRPYRQAAESPSTYAMIRMFEIFNALRAGETVNLESVFSNLAHPQAVPIANRARLLHYLQTRNLPLLRQTVESIGSDDLLSERLLSLSLRAFAALGMKEESEMATVEARKTIYRGVLSSWASSYAYDGEIAYDLSESVQDSAGLPRAWTTSLTDRVQNRFLKLSLLGRDAFTQKNWPALLAVSEQALRDYPTFYHFDWYKGEALYQLGRKEEAAAPLRVYLRYAKNELDYPVAADRLKEIETAVPTPAAAR